MRSELVVVELHESDLGAALQIGIQIQSIMNRNLADFPQGRREFVLTWIGGEFPQDLAGRDAPGRDSGGDAQEIGPVALDHGLVDLSADQARRWAGAAVGLNA